MSFCYNDNYFSESHQITSLDINIQTGSMNVIDGFRHMLQLMLSLFPPFVFLGAFFHLPNSVGHRDHSHLGIVHDSIWFCHGPMFARYVTTPHEAGSGKKR